MSPLPKLVEQAGIQAVAKKSMPWEITVPDFFEPVEKLKRLFAKLINAEDEQRIAIVPSVSYGIASVAKNIQLALGQNIVVVDEIFPSNYYAWKRLADENGGEIRVVKRPVQVMGRGRIWNERLLESIDSQTVVVALPHAHWTDGTLFDLQVVRQLTYEVGAALIIDGTQSVGAMPFDVAKIQPDAIVCAGYKWLLGGYGLGLAYYGERFDQGKPIEENWINRLGSQNFENLTNFQAEYKPGANRYCMGENSQFVAVPMLTASLELLLDWGVENIQAYTKQLSQPYLTQLADLGFEVEEPAYRSAHLVGIRLPNHLDLSAVKKATLADNVFVSYRAGAMRISPHLYNESRDFERLLVAIKSVCQ